MQVCTALQRDSHASTPPLKSFYRQLYNWKSYPVEQKLKIVCCLLTSYFCHPSNRCGCRYYVFRLSIHLCVPVYLCLVRDILVLALGVTAQPWRVVHFDEYVRHVKLISVNQSWIFIMVQIIKSFQEPLRVGE